MDPIGSILERPRFYHNIDGVGELGCGVMCLAYSFIGWMQVRSPKESAWHSMPVFVVYVGAMVLILHYGMKAIKERLTYPRTGFVKYRKRDAVWVPMIVGAVVAVLFTVAAVTAIRSPGKHTFPAPLIGIGLAASYAYGIARAVPWKWLVAGVMASVSLLLAANPADLAESLAGHSWVGMFWLTFMACGVILLLSGAISLWLYVRHTHAPPRDAQ